MSRQNYIFTSESVSEGHPDKICDRISDEVVDLFLSKDAQARVACETLVTTDRIVLAGEVRCAGKVEDDEIEARVRAAVRDIGYEQEGFHWETANVSNYLHDQSTDIAAGVDAGTGSFTEEGAGDQGIMFGYATNETPDLMPAPIQYSHEILSRMARLRKDDRNLGLEPDAKSQVTLVYEKGLPVRAGSVVISTQHSEGLSPADIREIVRPIVLDVLPKGWMCGEPDFYVNPTGNFVIGGPVGDSGLTGRKIIVDTYGGAAPHGGGAFSGKDPTKVDRSAAYASRYLAKNVVAAGLADRCTIQLSYAIGVAKPLSVYLDLHGTEKCDAAKLELALPEIMDLSPRGIRETLALNRPIYARTAAYGHFGRQPDNQGGFSWERTDLVERIRQFAG